jgi:hypothetical protein
VGAAFSGLPWALRSGARTDHDGQANITLFVTSEVVGT